MKIVFVYTAFESLGIEYLSAALKARGHQVGLVIDPCLFNDFYINNKMLARLLNSREETLARVEREHPDIIGFSVISTQFRWALDYARELKQRLGVPVVMGGMHPTSVPERVIKHDAVDYVIRGEAEYALPELMDALASRGRLDSIPNLVYKKNGAVKFSSRLELVAELDAVPFPDKDLFFDKFPFMQKRYLAMASRGCLYQCAFCNNNVLQKMYGYDPHFYRVRSVDNVLDELRQAKSRYSIEFIIFQDDLFCTKTAWLSEFSRRYRREIGIPFKLLGFHPFSSSEQSVRLLKDAGCIAVHMGVHTLDESRRQNIFLRPYSNAQVEKALELCRQNDLEVFTDFIVGMPGETEEELRELLRFQNANRLNRLDLFWLSLYPRTAIVDIAIKNGLLDERLVEEIEEGGFCTPITGEGPMQTPWRERIISLLVLTTILPRSWVETAIDRRLYRFLPGLGNAMHRVARLWKLDFRYDYNVKLYLETFGFFLSRKLKSLGNAG